MTQFIPAMLTRQVAAVSLGVGLLVLAALLAAVAIACGAVAIYHHALPVHGPAEAAWISGGALLAAAALVGSIAWLRLKRVFGSGPAKPAPAPASDLALAIAGVIQAELPKHAVPAALVALLGGVAVGLNPQAAQSLLEGLTRKPS